MDINRRPDEIAAAFAARHEGLVRRDVALRAGLTTTQIQRRLASRRWTAAAPGVYVVTGAPPTWRQCALAACWGGPSGTVGSHITAAAFYNLLPPSVLPHVTVPPGSSARLRTAKVHRSPLPQHHVTMFGAVPLTGAARTLVDSAGVLDDERYFAVLDTALCRELTTPGDITTVRGELAPSGGRRGSARVQRGLAVWTPGPLPGSPAEMRLIRRLVEWGFPMPERQIRVHNERGVVVARIDVGWPERRVGIEYDGREAHGPRRLGPDERRHAAVAALGWQLLRADNRDLRPSATRLRFELAEAFRRVA